MPTVLLTGIGGFVGSHAAEYLIERTDWNIIGIDSYRHKGDMGRIGHLVPDPRLKLIRLDLAVPIPLRIFAELNEVDYIWNFASNSAVDRSIQDPRDCWENNTALIINMLEAARTMRKVKAFFQVSTDEVYGPAEPGQQHKEWEAIKPSNPYSASKAAQEAACHAWWRTYGLPISIVNCMNMIGPRQDPEKYLPSIIARLRSKQEVIVHGEQGRTGTRFYTHAQNIAAALHFLSQKKIAEFAKSPAIDRWNIVGEKEIANLDLAQMVADHMGTLLIYRLVGWNNTRPGHDPRYALDGTKLAEAGWRHAFTIDDTIKNTVDWYCKNPAWLAF